MQKRSYPWPVLLHFITATIMNSKAIKRQEDKAWHVNEKRERGARTFFPPKSLAKKSNLVVSVAAIVATTL